MSRSLLFLAVLLGVSACGGDAEREPITEQRAVEMCQARMTKAHDVVGFSNDVASTLEDGLWDIRGTTEFPPGSAYHCSIVAESGEMGIATFRPR